MAKLKLNYLMVLYYDWKFSQERYAIEKSIMRAKEAEAYWWGFAGACHIIGIMPTRAAAILKAVGRYEERDGVCYSDKLGQSFIAAASVA